LKLIAAERERRAQKSGKTDADLEASKNALEDAEEAQNALDCLPGDDDSDEEEEEECIPGVSNSSGDESAEENGSGVENDAVGGDPDEEDEVSPVGAR
jgi:hypothetical protein